MVKMRLFSLLALVICAAGQLMAQSAAPVTLVKAGRLLDPRTGNVLSPVAVLIENGKIKEVGPPSQVQSHAPAGAKTVDLGSATLLPGLIDSHTHLLLDVVVPPAAESARRFNGDFVPDLLLAIIESPSKRVLLGAQMGVRISKAASRPCAISGTPESTAMLHYAMLLTPAAFPAPASWPPAGKSPRSVLMFKV
jgi:hypothetical protein